ncbi:MAG: T9SS type A sorting domain-containing protein [Bacteroidetes bacterium]|nr:T9SS type A sorting domain-containing protein [Bacteroidota bacterium]
MIYRKLIFLISLLWLSSTISAQYFGGEKNDNGIYFCENNNSFYLTGTVRSFGSGSEDVTLVKVSSDYQHLYHVEWGGIHHDISTKIISISDQNLLVIGHSWDAPGTRTGGFVTKYDTAGAILWTSYFGGNDDDYIFNTIETFDKGFLITGLNRAAGVSGATFLIKINKDGVKEWEKFYDTNNNDIGMDVIECSDSSILLLVNTSSFADKIAHVSEYISNDASKIILLKTDKMGNEIWRKYFGGINHDFGKRIVTDGNNYFYFVGSSLNNTNGSFDLTLNKIDSAGNEIWRKNYGGVGYEYGNDIDMDVDGNLLLTGTSSSFTLDEIPNIYCLKTDSSGTVVWENNFGGNFSEYGNCGKFLNDGTIAVLGSSNSRNGLDFDFYFIKLDASGEVIKLLDEIISPPIDTTIQYMIYPNPARTFVKITLPNEGSQEESFEFTLFDITGKIVKKEVFNQLSGTIYFDSLLSIGVYVYTIKTSMSTHKGKIIIN